MLMDKKSVKQFNGTRDTLKFFSIIMPSIERKCDWIISLVNDPCTRQYNSENWSFSDQASASVSRVELNVVDTVLSLTNNRTEYTQQRQRGDLLTSERGREYSSLSLVV